ncbi:MAG: hypothetical protein NTW61_02255 [Candidatus Melainabacteria bacterium]|nr:hypothetical protein [Candidatus Melainabacteria bacterium]
MTTISKNPLTRILLAGVGTFLAVSPGGVEAAGKVTSRAVKDSFTPRTGVCLNAQTGDKLRIIPNIISPGMLKTVKDACENGDHSISRILRQFPIFPKPNQPVNIADFTISTKVDPHTRITTAETIFDKLKFCFIGPAGSEEQKLAAVIIDDGSPASTKSIQDLCRERAIFEANKKKKNQGFTTLSRGSGSVPYAINLKSPDLAVDSVGLANPTTIKTH